MLGFFVCKSIVNSLMIDPARSNKELAGMNIKNKELQGLKCKSTDCKSAQSGITKN